MVRTSESPGKGDDTATKASPPTGRSPLQEENSSHPASAGSDRGDGGVNPKKRKHQQYEQQPQQKQLQEPSASDILDSGVYIPPAKRKMLEKRRAEEQAREAEKEKEEQRRSDEQQLSGKNANDKHQDARIQRQTWEEQKRVVHGTINRLNAETIKPLIHDLFAKVNLIRLRGVLAKSLLQAAVSSQAFSNVYAALVAVINSKLPEVGELVVKRLILSFRRHYRRRDKHSTLAVVLLLGQLFHQAVVHELIILQIASVLLDGNPTDDSVEVAVQLLQTTGYALLEVSPAGVRAVLERLRGLLHEGNLNKRVEYKMEQLLEQRKSGFRGENSICYPPVPEELDLVESDDQITFEISLDEEDLSDDKQLDVYSYDPDYASNEAIWTKIRSEILGLTDDEDGSSKSGESETDDDGSGNDGSSSSEEEAEEEQAVVPAVAAVPKSGTGTVVVQDLSEADLVHLRRTIYLTIMSSATFEECAHKLAKLTIPEGREEELINMLIECCSQERTFLRYYGLVAARFCLLEDRWRDAFIDAFTQQYTTIHRLETNKLRNVAKLFSHLLHTDAIPWSVLSVIHLNEDETTSSSRIFLKVLLQEMVEAIGMGKLKERFEDSPDTAEWYQGMFPRDNVRNTRYAINFFTSIGLGPLTDGLREFLKNAPKILMQQAEEKKRRELEAAKQHGEDDHSSVASSDSSSSSSTSNSSSSVSSSSLSSSSSSSYTSSSTGSYSSPSSDSRRRGRGGTKSRRRGRGRSRSLSSGEDSSSSASYSSRSEKGRRRARRRRRSDTRSGSRSPLPPRRSEGDKKRRSRSGSYSAEESGSHALKKDINGGRDRSRSPRSPSSSVDRSNRKTEQGGRRRTQNRSRSHSSDSRSR